MTTFNPTRAQAVTPTVKPTVQPGLVALAHQYQRVRQRTEQLAAPLETEDYCIQSMTDASPAKWHIAHTTWFFEQFVLRRFIPNYQPHAPKYEYLFNSYYNAVGPQHCRASRGVLSRPTVQQVYDYRHDIDGRMAKLFDEISTSSYHAVTQLVTLGLNHEQQHQELLVTDMKHMLSSNPLLPAYHAQDHQAGKLAAEQNALQEPSSHVPQAVDWLWVPAGIYEIGSSGSSGFTFDNEQPRHRVFVEACALASRLVSNREYLAFVRAGGYQQPQHWLAMGWNQVQKEGWQHPIYWYRQQSSHKPPCDCAASDWRQYTLAGPQPLDLDEPVCHVSYYEADAYARWAGARLPTEQEWEALAQQCPMQGRFQDPDSFHPTALHSVSSNAQTHAPDDLYGELWQWTSSSYDAYPGFTPPKGALGEYNGKFMCNQYVLRGGSCATPKDHYRTTYRNFFPPEARWQFSGIRLAKDPTHDAPA